MTERSPLGHDLAERLATPGCPVCALVARAVRRHLVAYATEGVNDLDVRARLRASRGYCAVHARQFLVEVRHPLGVAMIYEDVVVNLIRALETVDPSAAGPVDRLMTSLGAPRARAAADAAALAASAGCPACEAAAESERRVIAALLHELGEPSFLAAYRASEGLCLPHLRAALARARRQEQVETLVTTQLATWRDLHAQLGEFIRLQDYRFRSEPRGREQGAPARAIHAVAGGDGAHSW